MTAVFVAGSHTDVGKTHVACALITAAKAAGRTVDALKPVASGFDPEDWADSDPGRLLAALGHPLTQGALDAVCPLRFTAPLAPPMAAALEGKALALAPMAQACRSALAASRTDLFVLEGVGGLMSPIADDATGLDLMIALRLPAIIVGGSYLGGISHTLTALETLHARGLKARAVVISQDANPAAPDFAQTLATVARFAGACPVVGAPRDGSTAFADELLAALR